MIRELWSAFPRLMEERINGLLDEAEPSPAKAFLIYKACQRDESWDDSFDKFSAKISIFFNIPKSERKKSHFDALLDRPISAYCYESFDLNFQNAVIDDSDIQELASWAHHLMRLGMKTEALIISTDILQKTLHYITHPPLFEKAKDIRFSDFCNAWKKTVFKKFGTLYDKDTQKIYSELLWLQAQRQEADGRANSGEALKFCPSIYLTQTEIDWTEAVLKATAKDQDIPKFPLSKGPLKQRLIELQRTVSLYKIVQKSKLEDFSKHKEAIKATILDRCEKLLLERAR